MVTVINECAKIPYTYTRYDATEISANTLREILKPARTRGHFSMICTKTHYYNICCGFDIETTRTPNDNNFMWCWQLSIEKSVIIGRTWLQFRKVLTQLKKHLGLSSRKSLLVLVHNLGFEFANMRKEVGIIERGTFLKEKRQPLKLCTKYGVEFRDSMALTHTSLQKLAKDYTNTQKAVGDLDYKKQRNSKTEIDPQEYTYICNDVLILSEFARYFLDTYGKQKYLPLTITGVLRHRVQVSFSKTSKAYQEFIKDSYPSDIDFYNLLMFSVYRGGYTHGNMFYIDRHFKKADGDIIKGYDFTSSYPSVMVKKYFPHKFTPSNLKTERDLWETLTTKCFIIVAKFHDIKATGEHSLESKSKCLTCEPNSNGELIIDNGRVRVGTIQVALTELDFQLYDKFYTWEKMEIGASWVADRMYLPPYLLCEMFKDYTKKAELKAMGENYALEKSLVNSYYGLTVTRLNTSVTKYDGEDFHEDTTSFNYDKERSKAVLLPQWGVYVSNWARYNLMTQAHAIEQTGASVLYMDTDSVKIYQPNADTIAIINEYNERERADNITMCKKFNLDFEIFEDLGLWDLEYDNVTHFKCLGAKRYLITDPTTKAKITPTIAGLPKREFLRMCSKKALPPYQAFTDNMLVECCKLTTKYNDGESSEVVGGELMKAKTSCTLIEVDFNMCLNKIWLNVIAQYKERKILKNV